MSIIKLSISFILLLFLSSCGSKVSEENVESCFLDTPVNGSQVHLSQDFKIVGWAYDKNSLSSPEHVSVELNSNETKVFAAKRVRRPDVVKSFNTPGAEMSGYEVVIPANSLVVGHYEITILQETPEHNLKCYPNHIIEIVD